jgi:hypothetical protein
MSMVTPMTATQEKERGATQVKLSPEEAEMLRALVRRNDVAEMDALARLRTGGLMTSASYLGAARRRSGTGQVQSLRGVRTLTV